MNTHDLAAIAADKLSSLADGLAIAEDVGVSSLSIEGEARFWSTIRSKRRDAAEALSALARSLPSASLARRRAENQAKACVNVPAADAREWARGWRALAS